MYGHADKAVCLNVYILSQQAAGHRLCRLLSIPIRKGEGRKVLKIAFDAV